MLDELNEINMDDIDLGTDRMSMTAVGDRLPDMDDDNVDDDDDADDAHSAGGKEKQEESAMHFCRDPSCSRTRGFKRVADLLRHQQQVHLPNEKKEQFFCDYKNCERSTDPFHRKDHCRDHFRI